MYDNQTKDLDNMIITFPYLELNKILNRKMALLIF